MTMWAENDREMTLQITATIGIIDNLTSAIETNMTTWTANDRDLKLITMATETVPGLKVKARNAIVLRAGVGVETGAGLPLI